MFSLPVLPFKWGCYEKSRLASPVGNMVATAAKAEDDSLTRTIGGDLGDTNENIESLSARYSP